MSRKLTWLHLSDLHVCPPSSGWDARRVLDSLLVDLEKLSGDKKLRPDLIFFTGDAAFGQIGSAQDEAISDQLNKANEFLTAVCNCFHPVVPKRRVYLAPGNHDVNRNQVDDSDSVWLAEPPTLDDIERLIRDAGGTWQRIMKRLSNFTRFRFGKTGRQQVDVLVPHAVGLTWVRVANVSRLPSPIRRP